MKARYTLAAFLCLLPVRVAAADFCEGAKFTHLDKILTNQNEFLDKRVRTHAVLRTDAKEYTRISFKEKSDFTILATADDESTAYSRRHDLSTHPFNVVDDFFKKLNALEGARYKRDMSKIEYYRQDVMVCGRLVKEQGELRFALDDMHVERSYILPWKGRSESHP